MITSPVQRVFEAFGSYTNLDPFLLADNTINQIKGAFAGFKPAITIEKLEDLFYKSITGLTTQIREEARKKWMAYIQKVCPFQPFQVSLRFSPSFSFFLALSPPINTY